MGGSTDRTFSPRHACLARIPFVAEPAGGMPALPIRRRSAWGQGPPPPPLGMGSGRRPWPGPRSLRPSVCARVLHLAPHPDDESIGAAATLISLREHGHAVVNLACSLGRPGQRSRRRAELEDACRRAGFELVVIEPPVELS